MQLLHSPKHRTVIVVVSVLLAHALLLWGVQSGLLQRSQPQPKAAALPVKVIFEVPAVAKIQRAPAAKSAPSPSPAQAPAKPVAPAQLAPPVPTQLPAPALAPSMAAPAAEVAPGPVAAAGVPHAPAGSTAAAPTQGNANAGSLKVEQPSSTADYLHNPKPVYPRRSERLGEYGVVVLSVLVGADGKAREVTLKTSSGYERLDQAAREAVWGWTFVPGKRNGLAQEMSVDVPIRFQPP